MPTARDWITLSKSRELRALRRLQREQVSKSPFVFVSERGTPFSIRGFQAMVERAARAAGFDIKIHPRMLRHSCGYKLANDGVDTRTIQGYLGHTSTPSATPNWHRRASRAYFGTERHQSQFMMARPIASSDCCIAVRSKFRAARTG